jgi:exonuclease SbcC
MKLRSLTLNLFRQHVSSRITFPDGLVGVIGANGAGKTTIVEAIAFAIYGSRALRGKVEDVRTRSAPAKSGRGKRDQDLRVELALEHEGVVFRIERTLSDAALYVGGESQAVAVGNRDVSAGVSGIVGLTHDEFLSTYCTEQKGLEFLSGKKGATEREKFIVRMMGYDRLEDVQDLIRNDRKEKRAVLLGYESSLGTRDEIEKRLEGEVADMGAIRERHDEASKTLRKVESEFAAIRERMSKYEEMRARYLKERESFQSATVRLEERTKRRSDIESNIALARSELETILKPLSAAKDLSEALAKVRRQLDIERVEAAEALKERQAAEVEWRESVSRAQAEADMARTHYAQLESRMRKAGEIKGGSDCPTCGQSLGESFEQVRKHFLEEQRSAAKRVRDLERACKEVSAQPPSVAVAAAKLAESEARLRKTEAKLQELQSCTKLEAKIQSLEHEGHVVEGEIKLADSNKTQAADRITEIRFSEEEYFREKGAFDASQRLLEVARLQRVRLEGEVNTKEALIERTRADLQKFGERAVEVERLRRDVRLRDECDRVVTEFRKFVNGSIRPRMAELASEYLADLTDGRYMAVELESDFTPTVIEDGEAKPIVSGGEEDILNLCMRISLSHMLAERAGHHFSLLILDEVFGSLDERRRGNVLALLEKLRSRFEQIVIITHLDDVKDGVQHLVEVEYDEASGSAYVKSSEGGSDDFGETVNL